MSNESRARLEATKPQRSNFTSEDEFEESLAYWVSSVGRILTLTRPAFIGPPKPPDAVSLLNAIQVQQQANNPELAAKQARLLALLKAEIKAPAEQVPPAAPDK